MLHEKKMLIQYNFMLYVTHTHMSSIYRAARINNYRFISALYAETPTSISSTGTTLRADLNSHYKIT